MRGVSSYAVPPNAWLPKVVTNLTATGSTQGTALAIPLGQDSSIFTTVAASTGALLPGGPGVGIGEEYSVANHGANALLVYPAVGGKIGTLATNAGYSLPAGNGITFQFVGGGQWCVGV
jgi:hypothetical protein